MHVRGPSSAGPPSSPMNQCLKYVEDRFNTVGDKRCFYPEHKQMQVTALDISKLLGAVNFFSRSPPLLHIGMTLCQAGLLRSVDERVGSIRRICFSSITHFYWEDDSFTRLVTKAM